LVEFLNIHILTHLTNVCLLSTSAFQ